MGDEAWLTRSLPSSHLEACAELAAECDYLVDWTITRLEHQAQIADLKGGYCLLALFLESVIISTSRLGSRITLPMLSYIQICLCQPMVGHPDRPHIERLGCPIKLEIYLRGVTLALSLLKQPVGVLICGVSVRHLTVCRRLVGSLGFAVRVAMQHGHASG